MAEEQKLDVIKNGDFKNINLKTKVVAGVVRQGINPGNYIIVTKEEYTEGREVDMGTYKFYSCNVNYLGETVSFTLSEKEHDIYKELGGLDDRIKISTEQYTYRNKGKDKTAIRLLFELVE